jgi:hypothetical protein
MARIVVRQLDCDTSTYHDVNASRRWSTTSVTNDIEHRAEYLVHLIPETDFPELVEACPERLPWQAVEGGCPSLGASRATA